MALTRFGFIVTGDDFVQWTGTEHFRMKVVGVKSPEQGIQAAREMVADGIQLIDAIDYAVPVGVVAYGPESISGRSSGSSRPPATFVAATSSVSTSAAAR